MAFAVCGGAVLQCSFGMTPAPLMVLPAKKVVATMPLATIMDHKPLINIMPFGTCSSLANPVVAAATTAALGVLTPMPCVPVTTAPWTPGSPTVLIGGEPALNDSSQCVCNWGGIIKINFAGQVTIQIP